MSRQLSGLRICGQRGHPVVRRALVRFGRWLRNEYEFPVLVRVYLSPHPYIIARDGKRCTAAIWIPDDENDYPYIRIATGDYEELREESNRDDALAVTIVSFAHEIIHYRQWIETDNLWERGVAVKAIGLLRKYEKTTSHP